MLELFQTNHLKGADIVEAQIPESMGKVNVNGHVIGFKVWDLLVLFCILESVMCNDRGKEEILLTCASECRQHTGDVNF